VRPLVDRAAGWLLDPPREEAPASPPRLALAPQVPPPPEPERPFVAVLPLAPRCGTSTIARAVAATLAARDPSGAAILATASGSRAVTGLQLRPAVAAAARLARAAAAAGVEGVRAWGRLCLVPAEEPLSALAAARPAPIVADLAHGTPAEGTVGLADHVVLVAPPDVEPSLAAAVEAAQRADGHAVALVLNRVLGDPSPELAHAVVVPESRLAAQLTLTCRTPRGPLAAPASELAERSLAVVRR
jgi:hypothetical protein